MAAREPLSDCASAADIVKTSSPTAAEILRMTPGNSARANPRSSGDDSNPLSARLERGERSGASGKCLVLLAITRAGAIPARDLCANR